MNSELHCGACGEHFDDTKELLYHIDRCSAATVILRAITICITQADKLCHPVGSLIYTIKNNLDRYINLITYQM